MAAESNVKIVTSTGPGSKPMVWLEGPLPSDPDALFDLSTGVQTRADAMKPGPHAQATRRLAESLAQTALNAVSQPGSQGAQGK